MHGKRITLKDIAKKVGLSRTAVSMALRDDVHISTARREEIQRVAKELGYVPDPFLSGLAAYRLHNRPAQSQGVLAWVNHWEQPERMRGQFREFDAYWRGAETAAKKFGYKLDELRWEQDCPVKRFEQILEARGILGILLPPHHSLLDWGEFDWSKFSVVRFGLSVQAPDSNLVAADHFRSTVMAVKRIHGHGYERIGLIAGSDFERYLGGNYIGGFYYAQVMLGLKPIPPLLTDYGNRCQEEIAKQGRLLERWLTKYKPDAVLTTDGEIPAMIRKLGYRIPEDVAVAGTSVYDIPVDAGIDQRSESVGRIAAEMLVKQINVGERGEPTDPSRILVESRWQDGKSLPCKRAVSNGKLVCEAAC